MFSLSYTCSRLLSGPLRALFFILWLSWLGLSLLRLFFWLSLFHHQITVSPTRDCFVKRCSLEKHHLLTWGIFQQASPTALTRTMRRTPTMTTTTTRSRTRSTKKRRTDRSRRRSRSGSEADRRKFPRRWPKRSRQKIDGSVALFFQVGLSSTPADLQSSGHQEITLAELLETLNDRFNWAQFGGTKNN